MAGAKDTIAQLREALKHSPDNVPLRRMLAAALTSAEEFDAAEKEYQEALRRDADDVECKLGLASLYLQQGKLNLGIVLAEDAAKRGNAPASAFVLLARLLMRSGRIEEAVAQYKQAVDRDSAARDESLESTLGIGANPTTGDVVDGRLRASVEQIFEGTDERVERPTLTFSELGGMEAIKEEVRMKIILPMTNVDLYKAYGKPIGGGILLYGPPGCGKTHLARATAGEIKGTFLSVGLQDVLDMWIGQSEKQLHEIFETARRNRPSVLFFDEVDALAASRSDLRQSAGRHVINQFLSELDGVDASNDGVLILAATNAPWHLDSAFRRPGRFDRIIFVPPPDEGARASILQIHLVGKPQEGIDIESLARRTREFSGADLKAIVDRAIEDKLKDAMKSGRPEPLRTKDLERAVKQHKPTTKEWFATARNYAMFSNEGGQYDDVLEYLKLKK